MRILQPRQRLQTIAILQTVTVCFALCSFKQSALAGDRARPKTTHEKTHQEHTHAYGKPSQYNTGHHVPNHASAAPNMHREPAGSSPFDVNQAAWHAKIGLSAPPPWLKPMSATIVSRLNPWLVPDRNSPQNRRHFEKHFLARTTMDSLRSVFKLTNGYFISRSIVYSLLLFGVKAQTFSVLGPLALGYFALEVVASSAVYNHKSMFKRDSLVTPLDSPFKMREWKQILFGKRQVEDGLKKDNEPLDEGLDVENGAAESEPSPSDSNWEKSYEMNPGWNELLVDSNRDPSDPNWSQHYEKKPGWQETVEDSDAERQLEELNRLNNQLPKDDDPIH